LQRREPASDALLGARIRIEGTGEEREMGPVQILEGVWVSVLGQRLEVWGPGVVPRRGRVG
jgi:hypothetical protein